MATVAVANKPVTIQGIDYQVGDVVPNAKALRNYDTLVRVRKLVEKDAEDIIPQDVFEAPEPAPAPAPEPAQSDEVGEENEMSVEDLLKLNIDDIVAILAEADLDTVTAVIEVEQLGKNRATLIKRLEGLFE